MAFRRGRLLIILLLSVLVIFSGLFFYFNSSPMPGGTILLFRIAPGAGFHQVVADLSRKGMIRSMRFFKLLGRFKGAANRIKAGYYTIDSGKSALGLLDDFIEGKVARVRVTIPEGLDNRGIARKLASYAFKGADGKEYSLVDEKGFLQASQDGTILKDYGFAVQKSCEGFLFPSTYFIPLGYTPRQIVGMMVGAFKRRLGPELIEAMRRSRLGFYKTLILASIVEREAVSPGERPKIAGVFVNRYRIGMKFESCATIQYILGKVQKKLYYYQLKIPSPYNTYQNPGFPVGPIANPGMASIRAAATPDRHDYLYFVAKNDGTHVFSRTGREHNRAARRYQWSN